MLLFFDIGSSELLLIFLVIVIFFGANKIPELARGLGKGIRQFKDATGSIQREIESSMHEQPEVKKKAPENVEAAEKPVLPKVEPPSNSIPKTEIPTNRDKSDLEK